MKYIRITICILSILYLSLAPASDIPDMKILTIPHFDKLVHFTMYFTFASFFSAYLSKYSYLNIVNQFFATVGLVVLIGGGLEVLQEMLPVNRSMDIFDFIANTIGGISGFVIYNFSLKDSRFNKIFIS